MNMFRTLVFVHIASYFLNANYSSLAASLTGNLNNRHNTDLISAQIKPQANLLAQYQPPTAPFFRMEKLEGSVGKGQTINNQENSLSCTLQKWQLIGFFRDNQIYKTKGELIFEIVNNSSESKQFVLAELLFLNDLDRALTVSNPHRELQGQFIKLEPPLKPGETREYTSDVSYKSGWHKVQLKTCRWLKKGSEYWEIYPELKPKDKQES